ncbi:MAG: hypothetical protein D6681_18580 [Calditrichaeota bacterium]|nr:MAG: hypothetical protein D6681_18580 [Calditrichota bacterium]
MPDFLKLSWPFIIGFAVQGESTLVVWCLTFADRPSFWPGIAAWCVTLSFISFQGYYLAGRISPVLLRRIGLRRVERFLTSHGRLRHYWLLVLLMRFLYGLRNPIAIWLGAQNYPAGRFALFNLLGDLIWIAVWMGGIYWMQWLVPVYFARYVRLLRYGYFGALILILLYQVGKAVHRSRHT